MGGGDPWVWSERRDLVVKALFVILNQELPALSVPMISWCHARRQISGVTTSTIQLCGVPGGYTDENDRPPSVVT